MNKVTASVLRLRLKSTIPLNSVIPTKVLHSKAPPSTSLPLRQKKKKSSHLPGGEDLMILMKKNPNGIKTQLGLNPPINPLSANFTKWSNALKLFECV